MPFTDTSTNTATGIGTFRAGVSILRRGIRTRFRSPATAAISQRSEMRTDDRRASENH